MEKRKGEGRGRIGERQTDKQTDKQRGRRGESEKRRKVV